MNNYVIELINNWQPLYISIYNLGLIKLEILKAHIKNNLANSSIRLSKSLIRALIFFDKNPNKSLKLYINYQSLNNLIIQNRYSLSLFGKLLE